MSFNYLTQDISAHWCKQGHKGHFDGGTYYVGDLELFKNGSELSSHPHRVKNTSSLFLILFSLLPLFPRCPRPLHLSCSVLLQMEEEEDEKELQLLPSMHHTASSSPMSSESSTLRFRSKVSPEGITVPSSVDLQLSISVRPIQPRTDPICESVKQHETSCVEALKWEAAEQLRLAEMEKAYAERMKELTKKEMELAKTEFARAKQMWDRAREQEQVEKAERMKEKATEHVDSRCMEVTCQSCRKRFKP